MKRLLIAASVIGLLAAGPVLADETVTTTDGRSVLLKDDGTYEVMAATKANWQDYLAHAGGHLKQVDQKFKKVIQYMPNFSNISDKPIIGIKFTTVFKDSFGEDIKKINGTLEQKIESGKTSRTKLFYVFEDNQFINGETYDVLYSFVRSGTGSRTVDVTAIVFEGGEIVKF